MKKFFVAAAIAALTATTASAADIAARPYTKAPVPVVAPVYNWTGIYVGADIGGAWTNWNGAFDLPPPATFGGKRTDAIAGGFIGAQYQWQWLVLGVEGRAAGLLSNSFSGSLCNPVGACAGGFTQVGRFDDVLWTVGGRVGVAINNWMPYFTGGYAQTKFEQQFLNAAGTVIESSKHNVSGYYVGGGLDWAVYQNWILGVEYRHYDFDRYSIVPTTPGGAPVAADQVNLKSKMDSVTARLSYKFNWDGPVVAKY